MSARAHRVPHMFSEADHTAAISAAQAYRLDADADGDGTVHEIAELRSKRKRDGYYADDGLTLVEPSEDKPYSDTWISDRVTRQRLLDHDPYYRFAAFVSAGSKLPLDEFVNDDLVRAESQRQLAAAQQRVRESAEQRLQALATPAQIEQLRQRAADARDVEERSRKAVSLLVASLKCYKEALSTADERYDKLVDLPDSKSLFDAFTASAVALRGARGYEQTLAIAQNIASELTQGAITTQLTKAPETTAANSVRRNMPTSANLALYEALLALATGDAELVATLARATADDLARFADDSEYAQEPDEYARDLATLARLLFVESGANTNATGTSSLLLFTKITHTLYAHVNKMHRRAALNADTFPPLRRPVVQSDESRRKKRNVALGAGVVVIAADDEDLEALAEGQAVQAFEPAELAVAQSKLGDNQSKESTPRLVEALLEPMAALLYPRVFYSTSASGPLDDGLDYEAFAGGALDEDNERQRLAPRFARAQQPSPFFEEWLELTNAIVHAEWTNVAGSQPATRKRLLESDAIALKEEFTEKVLKLVRTELPLVGRNRREYKARVCERLVRSSRALLCAAQALVSAFDEGSGTRILSLTDGELKTLRDYIAATERSDAEPGSVSDAELAASEDAAYRLLARSRPSGIASDGTRGIIKDKASLIAFDAALTADKEIKDAQKEIEDRQSAAKTRADAIEKQADSLTGALNATIGRESGPAEQFLLKEALKDAYVPLASDALAPINSGIVVYSELMMASLQQAFDKLREFVPCLARTFGHYNVLIESPAYWSLFGSLVQAVLRLGDARNPIVYRPDATEQRARIQLRSALDTMRRAARDDCNVAHGHPSCNCGGNRAGLYPALGVNNTAYAGAVRAYTMQSSARGSAIGFAGMAMNGF